MHAKQPELKPDQLEIMTGNTGEQVFVAELPDERGNLTLIARDFESDDSTIAVDSKEQQLFDVSIDLYNKVTNLATDRYSSFTRYLGYSLFQATHEGETLSAVTIPDIDYINSNLGYIYKRFGGDRQDEPPLTFIEGDIHETSSEADLAFLNHLLEGKVELPKDKTQLYNQYLAFLAIGYSRLSPVMVNTIQEEIGYLKEYNALQIKNKGNNGEPEITCGYTKDLLIKINNLTSDLAGYSLSQSQDGYEGEFYSSDKLVKKDIRNIFHGIKRGLLLGVRVNKQFRELKDHQEWLEMSSSKLLNESTLAWFTSLLG